MLPIAGACGAEESPDVEQSADVSQILNVMSVLCDVMSFITRVSKVANSIHSRGGRAAVGAVHLSDAAAV
jgi:hypothetical protein